MLFNVNLNPTETYESLDNLCGRTYGWLKRIKTNNFGSHKYYLKEISKNKFELNLFDYHNTIGTSFDLRDKGLVFFFRHNNNEYAEACLYEKITIQSNDDTFVVQTDKNLYKFEILNSKKHLNFIKEFFNFKNKTITQ